VGLVLEQELAQEEDLVEALDLEEV